MRYCILVSHGTFAPGLHNALGMMAGAGREDILSTSLLDGMDVDTFRENFTELVKGIAAEDEILLFADIIGGSPLTNAVSVLEEKGLLPHTVAMGGMSLPAWYSARRLPTRTRRLRRRRRRSWRTPATRSKYLTSAAIPRMTFRAYPIMRRAQIAPSDFRQAKPISRRNPLWISRGSGAA